MPAWFPSFPPEAGVTQPGAGARAGAAGLLGDQEGLDGELVEGAAQAVQLQGLGVVLDALGDHLEAEQVGDAQDDAGQGRLLGPAQQAVRNGWGWSGNRCCRSRVAWQAACSAQRPMGRGCR
jgi:hypothetical protein